MAIDAPEQLLSQLTSRISTAFAQPETYAQLAIILLIYALSFVIAHRVRKLPAFRPALHQDSSIHPLRRLFSRLGKLVFPLVAILLLRISVELSDAMLNSSLVVRLAMALAMLILFISIIHDFIHNVIAATLLKWIGLPLLFLHLVGVLDELTRILESISLSLGDITISAYGVARVAIFGSLLFWFGRVSSQTGREIINRQENLELRTREVAAKLLEVGIFFVVFLLILQIMGINLTTLAVFGGALGVGLGFGLQAIASNFISGIIILLDRSVSIGDYVELENGRTGTVRQLNMRSTTLETYDGKDIVVPNEKFIVETFTNWTHKDIRQRYRVDFSVAYKSNVRKLVEIIKQVVASHPQVLSGDDVPFEECPDCEIDRFGDYGIHMFVEFWMEGVDDGKNRVGGDLLLMILEALQENGFEIPYPQREVRVLNPTFSVAGRPDTT